MAAAGVFSFPRSGTHFLLNTLQANFGIPEMFNFDYGTNIQGVNFFMPSHITNLLAQLGRLGTHVSKSHFQAPFFEEAAGELTDQFTFFYIHRHPAASLNSYRRLIHTWAWAAAPKRDNLIDFMNATPEGGFLLHLFRASPTMLDCWADHVEGWRALAAQHDNVHIVSYEDLRDDFDGQVRRFGEILGRPVTEVVAPARDDYIVAGDLTYDDPETDGWFDRGHALAMERHPELMAELGYG